MSINNLVTEGQLRSLVERIERLEEEKANIGADIKDVYGEARANGYDTKAIRHIIRLRKQDRHERDEFEYTVDLYKRALGMTPLEEYAERAKEDETTVSLSASDETEIFSGTIAEFNTLAGKVTTALSASRRKNKLNAADNDD